MAEHERVANGERANGVGPSQVAESTYKTSAWDGVL
jgi:hypothetical protein